MLAMETLRMRADASGPKDETSPKGANPFAKFHVGERWQELQGSNRWAGLLDPIDPVLRAEIVRYGEFAQACYDAFDTDRTSKDPGNSRYNKDVLLDEVRLYNRGYEITHFLYATARLILPSLLPKSTKIDNWSRDTNWIGFVAVCTSPQEIARLGRRDILVAWRGTQTKFEWIKDVQDYSEPAGFLPDVDPLSRRILVESGFLNVYTSTNQNSPYHKSSVRDQVRGAIKDLVKKYKDEGPLSITMTGHSLGSALATLSACDMAESQKVLHGNSEKNIFRRDKIPITVFSFAGPRVGNQAFRERVEELGVAVLRVANKWDMVTKVPGVLFRPIKGVVDKILPVVPCYKHVGTKLKIDFRKACFLEFLVSRKHATNIFLYHHQLEVYIHVVDGFHGTGLPFKPTLKGIALVNKGRNLLKRAENHIPGSRWQEGKKDLVKDKNGYGVVPQSDGEGCAENHIPASSWQEGTKDLVKDKYGHWVVPQSDGEKYSENHVPTCWWQEKDLVKDENGYWVVPPSNGEIYSQNHVPTYWWQKKDLVKDENGYWVVPPSNGEMFPNTPTPEEEFMQSVLFAEKRSNDKLGKDPIIIDQLGPNGDGGARRYKLTDRINNVGKKLDHFNLGSFLKL